jgi:hypothetical protein
MSLAKPFSRRPARWKILAVLTIIALALACAAPLALGAQDSEAHAAPSSLSSEWPSFRGDPADKGVTDAPTAKAAKDAKKNWEYKFRKDAGGLISSDPLLVGDRIYLAVSNGEDSMMTTNKLRIVALNKKGKLVKSVSVKGAGGADVGLPLSASIGYGAGKIYVPLTDGTICAYDAKTLKLAWRSKKIADGGANVISSIIYRGGYIYSGASTGSADAGCFFAINAKNGKIAWKYGTKGYYCAGAAFTSKAVFFAGDDGVLVSHDLKSGKVFDTYKLGDAVRADTVINGSILYVTTKAGKLYKVPVAKGGKKFKDKSVKSASLAGADCTSAPVIYNNRVYTFAAKEAFDASTLEVWNATTLKKLSSVSLGAYVNDEPLLTTAYAKKSNGYKVYLYVLQNDIADDLLLITDSGKQKKPTIKKLYSPGGDYAQGSAIAADDGTIYFYHSATTSSADYSVYYYDSRLVSLGNKAKK